MTYSIRQDYLQDTLENHFFRMLSSTQAMQSFSQQLAQGLQKDVDEGILSPADYPQALARFQHTQQQLQSWFLNYLQQPPKNADETTTALVTLDRILPQSQLPFDFALTELSSGNPLCIPYLKAHPSNLSDPLFTLPVAQDRPCDAWKVGEGNESDLVPWCQPWFHDGMKDWEGLRIFNYKTLELWQRVLPFLPELQAHPQGPFEQLDAVYWFFATAPDAQLQFWKSLNDSPQAPILPQHLLCALAHQTEERKQTPLQASKPTRQPTFATLSASQTQSLQATLLTPVLVHGGFYAWAKGFSDILQETEHNTHSMVLDFLKITLQHTDLHALDAEGLLSDNGVLTDTLMDELATKHEKALQDQLHAKATEWQLKMNERAAMKPLSISPLELFFLKIESSLDSPLCTLIEPATLESYLQPRLAQLSTEGWSSFLGTPQSFQHDLKAQAQFVSWFKPLLSQMSSTFQHHFQEALDHFHQPALERLNTHAFMQYHLSQALGCSKQQARVHQRYQEFLAHEHQKMIQTLGTWLNDAETFEQTWATFKLKIPSRNGMHALKNPQCFPELVYFLDHLQSQAPLSLPRLSLPKLGESSWKDWLTHSKPLQIEFQTLMLELHLDPRDTPSKPKPRL